MVLFKRSGERITPIGLSLYKNAVALTMLGVTLALLIAFNEPEHTYENVRHFSIEDICILLLSGIIGIAVADTLFFYALNLIGVGLISIVDCLYSPIVLLCAWIHLSEKLTTIDYAGGSLIIIACFHSFPP